MWFDTWLVSHQFDSAVLSMQCDQRKIVSGTADGEIQWVPRATHQSLAVCLFVWTDHSLHLTHTKIHNTCIICSYLSGPRPKHNPIPNLPCWSLGMRLLECGPLSVLYYARSDMHVGWWKGLGMRLAICCCSLLALFCCSIHDIRSGRHVHTLLGHKVKCDCAI